METDNGQIILEEEIDANYEPTQQEIVDYATWLGIDVDKEQDLLWIAKEGLKAPLPGKWKPCKTPEGDLYYFNFETGESIWDHPCDKHYRQLLQDERSKAQKRQQAGSLSPSHATAASGSKQQPASSLSSKTSPATSSSAIGAVKEAQKKLDLSTSAGSLGPLKGVLGASPRTSGDGSGFSAAKETLAPLKVSGGLGGGLSKLAPLGSASNSASASGSDWPNIGPALGGGSKPGLDWPNAGGALLPSALGGKKTPLGKPGTPSVTSPGDSPPHTPTTIGVTSTTATTSAASARPGGGGSGEREAVKEMRQLLEHEEQLAKQKLNESSEAVVADYKRQMEAREERLVEELALAQRKRIGELEQQHLDRLTALRKEHQEAEEKLAQQVAKVRRELQEQVSVGEQERQEARTKAQEEVQREAAAWAEAQRNALRDKLMDTIQQEVEAEMRPLRQSRLEDAMKGLDSQVLAAVEARKQEVDSLAAQVADQRKVLAELEQQAVNRRQTLQSLEAEAATCREQLPRVEAELSAKQRELQNISRDLVSKMSEFDEVLSKLRDKQRDLTEVTTKLMEAQAQASIVAEELTRKTSELQKVRSALVSETTTLSQTTAEQTSKSLCLAEVSSTLEVQKAALMELEKTLLGKQQELAGVTADLAKGRMSVLTQDVSLANELRARAGAEFSEIEAELNRARAELSVVAPELAHKQAELQSCQESLDVLTVELVDKQRRVAQAAVELSNLQAELSEVESSLVSKRHQLDTVATLLVSHQRELDYEATRKAISSEEVALLEVGRARMKRAVEEELAVEKAQLLDSKRALVRQEVDTTIAAERAAALATAAKTTPTASPPAAAASAVAPAAEHSKVGQPRSAACAPADQGHASASEGPSHVAMDLPPRAPRMDPALQKSLDLLLGQAAAMQGAARYDPSSEDTHSRPSATNPMLLGPGNTSGRLHWQESPEVSGGGAAGTHSEPVAGGWGGTAPQRPHLRQQQQQHQPVSPHYPHSHSQQQHPHHRVSDTQSDDTVPGPGLAPHTESQAATVAKAKTFLKQQKHFLRQRQTMVQNAISEWRASMAAVDLEPDPAIKKQQMRLLKSVKATLEEQAERVNADQADLSALKTKIRSAEASMAQQQYSHTASISLGGSLRSSSRGRGIFDVPVAAAPKPRSASASRALRSSLDKIARYLDDAMAAAANRSTSPGVAPRPDPVHEVAWAPADYPDLTKRARSQGKAQHSHDKGARSSTGMFKAPGLRGFGSTGGILSQPISAWGPPQTSHPYTSVGADLSFLSAWQDEQHMAHSLADQHSSWMQNFQQQVGSMGAPWPGHVRQSSPVPRGGFHPAAPAPVTVDIGNHQVVEMFIRRK